MLMEVQAIETLPGMPQLCDPNLQSTHQILTPVTVQLGAKSGSRVASEIFLVFSSGLLSNR